MMSGISLRDRTLWARGRQRLLGLTGVSKETAVSDSLVWLKDRYSRAQIREGTGHRVLVGGADFGVQPQAAALLLARGLAEALPRIILVDVSQGAEALSSRLELPRSPGLAELCQQKARFEDVVRRDPAGDLHILTSGKPRSIGGWGAPGMLDRVCRALDEAYALILFCAEHDEAVLLARTLKHRFSAGVMIRGRKGRQDDTPFAGTPADFEALGFPIRWIEQDC